MLAAGPLLLRPQDDRDDPFPTDPASFFGSRPFAAGWRYRKFVGRPKTVAGDFKPLAKKIVR